VVGPKAGMRAYAKARTEEAARGEEPVLAGKAVVLVQEVK